MHFMEKYTIKKLVYIRCMVLISKIALCRWSDRAYTVNEHMYVSHTSLLSPVCKLRIDLFRSKFQSTPSSYSEFVYELVQKFKQPGSVVDALHICAKSVCTTEHIETVFFAFLRSLE